MLQTLTATFYNAESHDLSVLFHQMICESNPDFGSVCSILTFHSTQQNPPVSSWM